MGFYNFDKDLKIATKTERKVAALIIKHHGFKIVRYNDDYKYDIMMSKGKAVLQFEVKEDFECWRTGNVAVEIECRGKPSGLEVTEADFIIYRVHGRNKEISYISLRPEVLKESIKDKNFVAIVSGGDAGSNTQLVLFRYEQLLTMGRLLFQEEI